MVSAMRVTNAVIFVFVLSLTSATDNFVSFFQLETSELPPAEECEICRLAGLSPFTTYVYQLCKSSGVFDKLFDVSFKNPTEVASGFFFSGMYFAQHMSSSYEGVIPLEDSIVGKEAFLDGLTPLGYFKPFANAIENYFTLLGIMTPLNMQSLAYDYYKELENSLKDLGLLDTPLAHIYAITVSNVNIMKSYGKPTPEMVVYMMEKLIQDFEP